MHDVLVEADLDQPDHAIVTLSNLSTKHSEQVNEGDDLEVKLGFVDGKDQGSVFKGEVVGIEPIYDSRAARARAHPRLQPAAPADARQEVGHVHQGHATRTSSTSCARRTA